jgi:SAM-dependent methyltransferase
LEGGGGLHLLLRQTLNETNHNWKRRYYSMENHSEKIGEHWSKVTKDSAKRKNLKLRWWQSPHVIRHINQLVCGEPVPGFSSGLIKQVRNLAAESIPFKRGISVGGGNGQKEISLIKQGLVSSFDLYELSETRIAAGEELARKESVEQNINFIFGDAFGLATKAEEYDFVHWNNSLHHMLDVDQAVAWSKQILKPGGLFYMDDFIGASRFQWPGRQLEIATKVRKAFQSSKYMQNPRDSDKSLAIELKRPSAEKLIQDDPSEAADSDRIIDSIIKYFPNAEIKITGGVIYHLALSDMLHNFDETEDKILLDLLMIIDELCADSGQTHYGTALAIKEDG